MLLCFKDIKLTSYILGISSKFKTEKWLSLWYETKHIELKKVIFVDCRILRKKN